MTTDKFILFCEAHNFGFSISRTAGNTQYTIFVHTDILKEDGETEALLAQSIFLSDALSMAVTKTELLLNTTITKK